jgi:hypothetical protein
MNLKNHHGFEKDFDWLKSLHGASLVDYPVTQDVCAELERVFDNW